MAKNVPIEYRSALLLEEFNIFNRKSELKLVSSKFRSSES
jgi:hypothetical protein